MPLFYHGTEILEAFWNIEQVLQEQQATDTAPAGENDGQVAPVVPVIAVEQINPQENGEEFVAEQLAPLRLALSDDYTDEIIGSSTCR